MKGKISKTGGRYVAVVVAPAITWFAAVDGVPTWAPTNGVVAAGNAEALVKVAGTTWAGRGREVTVLMRGMDVDLQALADKMRADGYAVSYGGIPHGWLTVRRGNTGGVHLGVMTSFGKDAHAVFTGADSRTIVTRLATFARLTGAAWQGKTPGIVGTELLRRRYIDQARKPDDPQVQWAWSRPPMSVGGGFPLLAGWAARKLTDDERKMRFAHRFDVRLMYLSAFTGVEVGYAPPARVKGATFDRRRAGYWLIDTRDVESADRQSRAETGAGMGGIPDVGLLIGPDGGGKTHRTWVTTPIAALLEDCGADIVVHDAWLSPAGDFRRVFRGWGEELREAVREAETLPDATIRSAVKDVANHMRGLLMKDTGRISRRDWADQVVDHARAMLLRKVAASGYDPVRYVTDSVWIVTDNPPDVAASRLGAPIDASGAQQQWRMGAFRYEETVTPDEFRAMVGED